MRTLCLFSVAPLEEMNKDVERAHTKKTTGRRVCKPQTPLQLQCLSQHSKDSTIITVIVMPSWMRLMNQPFPTMAMQSTARSRKKLQVRGNQGTTHEDPKKKATREAEQEIYKKSTHVQI